MGQNDKDRNKSRKATDKGETDPKRKKTQDELRNENNSQGNSSTAPNQSGTPKPKLRYDLNDTGPFIAHVQQVANGQSSTNLLMAIQVSRILGRAGVKFEKIESLSRRCWLVTFASRGAANDAIDSLVLKDHGLEAFIPFYRVFRKGVVKDIPEDIEIPELIQLINTIN